MAWTSISEAHAYWSQHKGEIPPPVNLERVEAFILNKRPNTTQDAVCILDIVCAYPGDLRCDGLDHAALRRVRGFLTAT